MMRGTTPTITFTLPFDTKDIKKLWVTFSQNEKEIFTLEKNDCELDGDVITVKLTQAQTLKFSCEYPMKIQLRVLDNYDVALASEIIKVYVDYILKEGEI